MRIRHAVLSLSFVTAALLGAAAGCGGGAQLDCNATCAKITTCGSSKTMAECQKSCATLNQVGDSSYIGAFSECASKACDQQSACAESAVKACSNDAMPYFDGYCAKVSSCNTGITEDACKAQLANPDVQEALAYLKCINDATLSQLASCIQSADCADLDTASQKCAEDIVGDIG